MNRGRHDASEERFDRNQRFFGAEGQAAIRAAGVGIVGLGGLGSHMAQQLAYLGVRRFLLIDRDHVTESSLNRLVGSTPSDAENATAKVLVATRTITQIEPEADVEPIVEWLDGATDRLRTVDLIIGGLDDDVARLALTALASAAELAYVDAATEIGPRGEPYGGRVVFCEPEIRCLWCLGELDPEELALATLTPEQRRARDRNYGLSPDTDRRGAAVVSINGVVASLAVTETMVWLTGLRRPAPLLRYRADLGGVTRRTDEPVVPCPYCRRE
jgi:hypothetical protein